MVAVEPPALEYDDELIPPSSPLPELICSLGVSHDLEDGKDFIPIAVDVSPPTPQSLSFDNLINSFLHQDESMSTVLNDD